MFSKCLIWNYITHYTYSEYLPYNWKINNMDCIMRSMIIKKTYGQILFQNLGDWVVPFEEQVCHPKCEIYNKITQSLWT